MSLRRCELRRGTPASGTDRQPSRAYEPSVPINAAANPAYASGLSIPPVAIPAAVASRPIPPVIAKPARRRVAGSGHAVETDEDEPAADQSLAAHDAEQTLVERHPTSDQRRRVRRRRDGADGVEADAES